MSNKVIMPKMGESIVEGTIIEWKKNIGDFVSKDEILLEISTDKVDSEIPSPFEGTLTKILFNKNDTVEVGSVIALIGYKYEVDVSEHQDKAEQTSSDESSDAGNIVIDNTSANLEESVANEALNTEQSIQDKRSSKFYSPLVKKIAKEEGVSLSELESVSGSGLRGRVIKKDHLEYIE